MSTKSHMSERFIEAKLVRAVHDAGGLCPKWVSPGWAGVPDRMILLPGGHMAFAELKAPGEKPRPLQESRIQKLRGLGYRVYIIDNIERIGEILHDLQSA